MTNSMDILYINSVVYNRNAVVAQSVARRLGKAEVGGSSPLGSFLKRVSQNHQTI